MKRATFLTALCLLILLSGCGGGVTLSNSFTKPGWKQMMASHELRIGILEFRGDNNIAPILADELAIRLLNRGYKVMDRSDMRLVLEQAGISQFGDTTNVIAALKNSNKVDVLVTGNIVDQGIVEEAGRMTVKVFQISEGQTMMANSYNFTAVMTSVGPGDLADAIVTSWP